MSVQHTAFVLKILSGINAGASVRLKVGDVVIGRSMNSDIILHDDSIADQHIRLHIKPDGITLYPLAQPVFIGENEAGREGVPLPPFQSVRLGNVEFTVADGSKSISKAIKTSSRQADTANKGNTGEPQPRQTPSRAPNTPWNNGLYLWLGLGLLLLGNFIFFAPQLDKLLEQTGMVSSPEKRASEMLQKLGRKDFKLEKEPSGQLSLSGYTRTTAERNSLLQQLQEAGIQANIHIWSQEEMADSATTVARSLGEPAIKVSAGDEPGSLNVRGYVSQSTAWERIQAVIKGDVSGIRTINADKLQSMDSYMASFVQFVEKNGLPGRLNITTDGKRVIVKGELTQQEIDLLSKLRQEFIETYGSEPAIALEVVDVRSRIRLAIRSVSVGKVPFMVAKDGKKYMEGSAIGENYFVKSITPDHVVLVNNGMEVPFYYGLEGGRKP
jgi:type III secretion system YscD/HrpQ family protein